MILLLIGPHGAGKTTLGHALAAELRWPFHDEVGRRLAADPKYRPRELSAEAPQPAFDLAVMTEEIARDLLHPPSACSPRIVETWHPGNIVYAARRSPAIACAMLTHARIAIDWTDVLVLPVTAPDDVLRARHSELGSHEFFCTVASDALALARAFGAHVGAPVWSHEHAPRDIARALAPQVRANARHLGVDYTYFGAWRR